MFPYCSRQHKTGFRCVPGDVVERDPATPEKETVMAVVGFEDAIVAAVHVQVDANLTIPVASLAGIAVLKLFAWHDRQTNDKDALDLYRLISSYLFTVIVGGTFALIVRVLKKVLRSVA